jgi:hypothetical protein
VKQNTQARAGRPISRAYSTKVIEDPKNEVAPAHFWWKALEKYREQLPTGWLRHGLSGNQAAITKMPRASAPVF